MMSQYELQQYWWIIISVLGGLLAFLMFVQGGQTLLGSLSSTEDDKNLIINSLGRKWEYTFTALVVFGGAMFAAFPLFYACSFGGAYWAWMTLLFSFIIQAVSFEFRRKQSNFLGVKVYDYFLFVNGCLAPFLVGVVVATMFTGASFTIDEMRHTEWYSTLRGLEALFNMDNIALGLTLFVLSRVLACLYILNNVANDAIRKRCRAQLKLNAIVFLAFFVFSLLRLMTLKGYTFNIETGTVSLEDHKYFNNFIEQPLLLIVFLSGVSLTLLGIYKSAFSNSTKGIWFSGFGSFLVVAGLIMNAGLNQTCFYPSLIDMQSSLNIQNASSSHYTLSAMAYVSLFIPFIVAYIYYAWKVIDKKKMDKEVLEEEHNY